MELPPDPNQNPHLRAELQRNRAPDRFTAGPQSVKAARLESFASLGQRAYDRVVEWCETEPGRCFGPRQEAFRPPNIRAPREPEYEEGENLKFILNYYQRERQFDFRHRDVRHTIMYGNIDGLMHRSGSSGEHMLASNLDLWPSSLPKGWGYFQ